MSISITKQADGTYRLEAELWLPRTPEEVFPFFGDAHNLQELTPPWLNFEVLTPRPIDMRSGTLIDYKLRVRMLPVRWKTLIETWEPNRKFVDTQLRGPYKLWHHTHEFVPSDGGTLCTDVVRYRPLGGAISNWLFVQRDVQRIFTYRQQRLVELFGDPAPTDEGRHESEGVTVSANSAG